ncbi:type I-E CRISPR-associated protein Cas5/CasD [Bifidobacterium tissieri]|uniref:Type I-E CRISPR-associated protein Cas5/CasD n=1 Tax=Bifidobacterium tissieri TaxID=1630162 RepID=A0A5M9ZX91_9BIFI|nr:type I-E CRISPR-associated protein Cas5/CasD [Bifidobacterium tissieri]KAA8832176.1 type I-E CRISPR-associated protein Cas5/CasD [Bifidobacterium tissieri]KAA8832210.1 type I-E CRISPR-associated protein Cas5/CasD [Bifidobacterium tissieri]
MPVLLMRLAAPMQSWGSNSRFTRRETETMPTKSGVIGMIAAALGIGRGEPLARFQGLRFGVRADQPGTLLRDYQTAKNERGTMMPLSNRYYLQDAVFLVGLESDNMERLEEYRQALRSPHYPIFLGRRSCPPDGPIQTWMSEESLEDALRHAPWRAAEWYQRRALRDESLFPERCFARIMIEPNSAEQLESTFVDTLADEPVSFDPRRREWRQRRIVSLTDDIQPEPTVDRPLSPDASVANSAGRLENENDVADSQSLFDGDAIFDAIAGPEGEDL